MELVYKAVTEAEFNKLFSKAFEEGRGGEGRGGKGRGGEG